MALPPVLAPPTAFLEEKIAACEEAIRQILALQIVQDAFAALPDPVIVPPPVV